MPSDSPDVDGPEDSPEREISDLIGVELTLALLAWFLLVLGGFFFVGPVVGTILVLAGAIGFGWFAVAAIRRW